MIRAAVVALASIVVVSQEPLSKTTQGWETAQEARNVVDGVGAEHAVRRSSSDLWRDYRVHVVLAVAVGLVQTLLIVALVFERRRRHGAEQEAQRHLENAAHLDRRATLGELSAVLAHELNQPLGAIMHNAEAAEMALDSSPVPLADLREILADIRKEDSRASELITRMRTLLQKHELDPRPLDVNDLARETVALVVPAAVEKGVCVDMELGAGLTPVLGDRVHLQQVLLNVLLNGMDAMAAVPRNGRQLTIRTAHTDHCVEVSVEDAGCGIALDAKPRIFEPFYTTKAQGMGVGLSIARSIVEAHGGRIVAENNGDGGATFRFTIPVDRGVLQRG